MVFRSFSKLHPNGPVPHQISPPNSRFINPVRAFLAFTYLSKSHAWRGSPSWYRGPPLLAGASQPKNLPFQPCGRRVSPIQAASFHLQSGDGECLPATQLYLSVFTCPTVSLDLPSDAGASSPARHPYLFHPTAGEAYPSRPRVFSSGRMLARASWPHNLPFCLYLSNTASLDLPLDACASSPARQPYLSTCCSTRLSRPTRRFWNQSDVGESLRDKQPYLFKPTARPGLPVRHGDSETSRTSARASGTNNLTFSNLLLDQAYPSDTAILKPVGRRREPPGQTIFLFHPAAGKAYPTTLPVDWKAFRPPKLCLSV